MEFGPELNLAVFRGISPRGVLSGFLGEERGQRREKEQGGDVNLLEGKCMNHLHGK